MIWGCVMIWPRSFGQVQGHWKEKCQIYVSSLSFLWRNIESSRFTQRLLMTWGCVLILSQGHLGNLGVLSFVSLLTVPLVYKSNIRSSNSVFLCPSSKKWGHIALLLSITLLVSRSTNSFRSFSSQRMHVLSRAIFDRVICPFDLEKFQNYLSFPFIFFVDVSKGGVHKCFTSISCFIWYEIVHVI